MLEIAEGVAEVRLSVAVSLAIAATLLHVNVMGEGDDVAARRLRAGPRGEAHWERRRLVVVSEAVVPCRRRLTIKQQ